MSLPARLSPRDSGGPAQMLGTARQRGVYAYRTEVRAWLLLLRYLLPARREHANGVPVVLVAWLAPQLRTTGVFGYAEWSGEGSEKGSERDLQFESVVVRTRSGSLL